MAKIIHRQMPSEWETNREGVMEQAGQLIKDVIDQGVGGLILAKGGKEGGLNRKVLEIFEGMCAGVFTPIYCPDIKMTVADVLNRWGPYGPTYSLKDVYRSASEQTPTEAKPGSPPKRGRVHVSPRKFMEDFFGYEGESGNVDAFGKKVSEVIPTLKPKQLEVLVHELDWYANHNLILHTTAAAGEGQHGLKAIHDLKLSMRYLGSEARHILLLPEGGTLDIEKFANACRLTREDAERVHASYRKKDEEKHGVQGWVKTTFIGPTNPADALRATTARPAYPGCIRARLLTETRLSADRIRNFFHCAWAGTEVNTDVDMLPDGDRIAILIGLGEHENALPEQFTQRVKAVLSKIPEEEKKRVRDAIPKPISSEGA